jgi:hypothetical protein
MYIVQIKKETETWIVAICQIEEDAANYLKTLPEEIQADALLFEVPIEYYPFILIQNTETPHNSDSYFEYSNFETLQTRIDTARKNRIDSDEHVYFKYYYISEPYTQMVSDNNFMHYLSHTSVTNHTLDQPYPISFFHEEVKKNASRYDLDRLDQLFEHTKTQFTSALEKEDLALNGYESLFWEMNYDHACSKLTEDGMSFLLPMVDNMEILLGEKKWQHRSFALHILLEHACKNNPETALGILQDTVNAFEQYLIAQPEEKLEIHRLLSLSYRWMMQTDPDTAFQFWQQAVSEIEKAIDADPEKASWSSLFDLLYIPYPEHSGIKDAQKKLQEIFNKKTEELENTLGAAISYPIALAYQHLKEQLEWKNIENISPESTALRWAEKAIAYNPDSITRIDLHECAEFFNRIGFHTQRIDFLLKTISLHERVIKATDDCPMEIYYIASIWKQIAVIHLTNKEQILADEAIGQAQSIYKKHLNQIKSNRSSFLHYAEFLEYCYTYEGAIPKPTLSELKHVANEIEMESEGFLSYPYVLLMRIALFENNEQQAIIQGTKSLILHELCADSTFNGLCEEFADTNFNEFNHFLQETKLFMKEVSEGYYYNPDIKWNQLRTMSSEEIRMYWEKRKEEIRKRKVDSGQ